MKTLSTLALATLLGTAALPSSASAFDFFHPFRPRVNEVNGRLNNEQRRINNGVATGRLNPWQANRMERGVQHIQRQESRDRFMHNGHLTGRETVRLNREENRVSGRINHAESRPSFFHRWFGRR